MRVKKTVLLYIFFLVNILSAAEKFSWYFENDDLFKITVRSNFMVYKNGKYLGLTSREIEGIFKAGIEDKLYVISGEVYYIEKMIRNGLPSVSQVDAIEKSVMYFTKEGTLIERKGSLFPPIQGYPFFPDEYLEVNDIYSGSGFFSMTEAEGNGVISIPVNINSQYKGLSNLNGDVYHLFEKSFILSNDSIPGKKIRGKHTAKMFFDNESGRPVYMDDRFEDTVIYASGNSYTYRGFYLYFYNQVKQLNRKPIIDNIKIAENDGFIKETERGILITLNNLHFLPDSTEIVESDKRILESIYNVIKDIPDRTFMIIGHTAETGNPDGEKKLSVERAFSVAEYFKVKGIRQDKLLYTGMGSLEPAAPNDTEENRRKNRRVEIIIMED